MNTQERLIERREDLTVAEIEAVWYTKSEYADMREEVSATVKLIRAGLTDPERVGFCYRGLEYKAANVGQIRSENMDKAFGAVFAAQRRGVRKSVPSERLELIIAKKYEGCAAVCQHQARKVGEWDAKNVELMWRSRDETPKPPARRRTARAAKAG